jgi:CheY-like chemotaxis protein
MGTPRVILYVEDRIEDRFFFERACRTLCGDFIFRHVENGEEARDYLLARGRYADTQAFPMPDAVITDLRMPRLDGIEFLAWARAQVQFEKLPIFLFSGVHRNGDTELAQRHKVTGFFKKPANTHLWVELVQQMVATVRSHLDVESQQKRAA